jgi:hypothetical protein
MQCANCGDEFDDALAECPHCQGGEKAADGPEAVREQVADDAWRVRQGVADESLHRPQPGYRFLIVYSVLATVLLCMPLGIVAIVYAVMADGAAVLGNVPGAKALAEKATWWTWLTVFLAIGMWAVILLGAIMVSNYPNVVGR